MTAPSGVILLRFLPLVSFVEAVVDVLLLEEDVEGTFLDGCLDDSVLFLTVGGGCPIIGHWGYMLQYSDF